MGEVCTAQERAPEYRVKMVFLYKFAKFVEWPGESFVDAKAPLVIGILGKDPFGPSFDAAVKGRTAQGRSIRLQRFAEVAELAASTCHILYIADSEAKDLDGILAALALRPLLTVGDLPGFTASGGMMRFKVLEQRIGMEVNLAVAQRSGLRISSRLLKMVEIYKDGEDGR